MDCVRLYSRNGEWERYGLAALRGRDSGGFYPPYGAEYVRADDSHFPSVTAGQPVLVDLEVAPGGAQRGCCDPERFRAAQQVAEERLGPGTAAGLEAAVNIAAQ